MKVAFNARTLSAKQLRGWSRYFSNLVRELSHYDLEIFLFSDRKLNMDLLNGANKEKLKIVVKSGFFYLDWEQRVLPQLCEEYDIDILHCPINYGLPYKRTWKQVLTLHDAIEMAYYDPFKSLLDKVSFQYVYLRSLHYLSQKVSDQIITVSRHAKQDIQRIYGTDPNKVKVVYEAADPIFHQEKQWDLEELKQRFNLKSPYLFYVGGFDKRKNLGFMLQALAQTKGDYQLVIAGGGAELEALRNYAVKLGIHQRVQFLGWVEDKDLPALYQNARAFVYPSLYEGFGLQITEAMALGCPILCSNATSLPEVWGNGESTFNPNKWSELKDLMDKVMDDDHFHQNLKTWAIQRSKDFSWSKTAQQTLEVYKNLIG